MLWATRGTLRANLRLRCSYLRAFKRVLSGITQKAELGEKMTATEDKNDDNVDDWLLNSISALEFQPKEGEDTTPEITSTPHIPPEEVEVALKEGESVFQEAEEAKDPTEEKVLSDEDMKTERAVSKMMAVNSSEGKQKKLRIEKTKYENLKGIFKTIETYLHDETYETKEKSFYIQMKKLLRSNVEKEKVDMKAIEELCQKVEMYPWSRKGIEEYIKHLVGDNLPRMKAFIDRLPWNAKHMAPLWRALVKAYSEVGQHENMMKYYQFLAANEAEIASDCWAVANCYATHLENDKLTPLQTQIYKKKMEEVLAKYFSLFLQRQDNNILTYPMHPALKYYSTIGDISEVKRLLRFRKTLSKKLPSSFDSHVFRWILMCAENNRKFSKDRRFKLKVPKSAYEFIKFRYDLLKGKMPNAAADYITSTMMLLSWTLQHGIYSFANKLLIDLKDYMENNSFDINKAKQVSVAFSHMWIEQKEKQNEYDFVVASMYAMSQNVEKKLDVKGWKQLLSSFKFSKEVNELNDTLIKLSSPSHKKEEDSISFKTMMCAMYPNCETQDDVFKQIQKTSSKLGRTLSTSNKRGVERRPLERRLDKPEHAMLKYDEVALCLMALKGTLDSDFFTFFTEVIKVETSTPRLVSILGKRVRSEVKGNTIRDHIRIEAVTFLSELMLDRGLSTTELKDIWKTIIQSCTKFLPGNLLVKVCNTIGEREDILQILGEADSRCLNILKAFEDEPVMEKDVKDGKLEDILTKSFKKADLDGFGDIDDQDLLLSTLHCMFPSKDNPKKGTKVNFDVLDAFLRAQVRARMRVQENSLVVLSRRTIWDLRDLFTSFSLSETELLTKSLMKRTQTKSLPDHVLSRILASLNCEKLSADIETDPSIIRLFSWINYSHRQGIGSLTGWKILLQSVARIPTEEHAHLCDSICRKFLSLGISEDAEIASLMLSIWAYRDNKKFLFWKRRIRNVGPPDPKALEGLKDIHFVVSLEEVTTEWDYSEEKDKWPGEDNALKPSKKSLALLWDHIKSIVPVNGLESESASKVIEVESNVNIDEVFEEKSGESSSNNKNNWFWS